MSEEFFCEFYADTFSDEPTQYNKYHIQKLIANIILNGEKLKAFALRSGISIKMPTHHYYSTQFEVLAYANQGGKKKRESKMEKRD